MWHATVIQLSSPPLPHRRDKGPTPDAPLLPRSAAGGGVRGDGPARREYGRGGRAGGRVGDPTDPADAA
eukprot:1406980-Prymnesium_polylepis.1